VGQTAINQLPYPEATDPADVPTDIRELADAVDVLLSLPLVTALPASPFDGQEIIFQADAANGINWHLRYHAASVSSYKWEYVGGSALRARIDTDQTFALGGYTSPATPGPSVTLPCAGDYVYTMIAQVYVAGQTAGGALWAGLNIGGAAPTGADQVSVYTFGGATVTPMKQGDLTGQPAGRVLQLMYQAPAGVGGTPHTRYRSLFATPVRVG
jgi:hypothetical protein